jgi:monoamine oxidase
VNVRYGAGSVVESVLVCFQLGREAREWSEKPVEQRHAHLLRSLCSIFGSGECMEALDFVEHDWCAEPWSRGAYMSVAPPGLLTTCRSALTEPVNGIHWAGTHTAREWPGYIEGGSSLSALCWLLGLRCAV